MQYAATRTHHKKCMRWLAWMLLAALAIGGSAQANGPRVLPAGKTPDDKRLGPLKDLDGYFPFSPSRTPDEWNARSERVKRQILVANGLWPMPTKTPANAVVHGKLDRGSYTVEKVYLESVPGHFVCGNLYRPKGKTGRLPAVLAPHGHWANGRFLDTPAAQVKQEIAAGAEKFEAGGRSVLQALCVQLARMGCVVFHYDMLGNADSQQLSAQLVHGFAKPRPEMDSPDVWGFYSSQAESRLQSIMGLQSYNSIRALDWITTLPDVDPQRIGVTGASGGGTQTFILCAIDPRPAVAFPAVMVSTAMQGGCTCENCSLLRIGTGNIEFAALFAPKPLGMTAANDWTKEIETKGLPELKQHYAMLGAADRVMAKSFLQFGHNYNYVSRAVMYDWMNKHLKIGAAEPIVETDYQPLTIPEMSVWDDAHPKPPAGDAYENTLTRWLADDASRQIAALAPKDKASLATYRQVVGGAVDTLVGRELPAAGAIEYDQCAETDRGEYIEFAALLRNTAAGEAVPAVFLHPKRWNRRVVVCLFPNGKSGLFQSDGSLSATTKKLLAAGSAVGSVDVLYQGEFLADGKPLAATRRVDNPREAGAYTWGYNSPLVVQRAHDVLSAVSFCRHFADDKPDKVELLAFAGTAPWAALALARSHGAVDRAAIDTAGFRFGKLKSLGDLDFLPGSVKYGDLPALLALCAPTELRLAGEGEQAPPLVQSAYQAADAASKLTLGQGTGDAEAAAAAEWLSK